MSINSKKKEKIHSTLAEAWVMLASSSTSPEEREFVTDSGLSMHVLSKMGLSSGELECLRRSRNHMTVVTANGEVQTNEEAQVHVRDLILFVTVQLLETSLVAFQLPNPPPPSTRQIEWARTKHATTAGSVFPLTNTYQLQVRNCARKVYAGGQHASHAPVTRRHYPAVHGRLKP